jgi:mono/diheme cytochrome c family protein
LTEVARKRKIRMAQLLVMGATLLLGYTNCGLPFHADGTDLVSQAASRSICEDDLQATFKSAYLPLITTNCASCHNDAGVSPVKLASSDQTNAYNAFMQATEALVATNAVSASHAPGHSGPALQGAVSAAHALWQPSYDAYNLCVASGSNGQGSSTSFDLLEKNFSNLYFADNQTVTATWDLNSEGSPIANRFAGTFLMDVKVNYTTVNGVKAPAGYIFTNPRIQMLTGDLEADIQAIVVRVNGAKLSGLEPFLSAQQTARRIDPVIFYSGSLTSALPTLLSSDRISVSFGYVTVRARTDALVTPPNPSLSISNSYTNQSTLNVTVANDATARRWCLTTVNIRPTTTAMCPGYEGSAITNGWLTAKPTTFNLADMGALVSGVSTPLYVWVANADLKINVGIVSSNYTLDTTLPTAATFTVTAGDTQMAILNIGGSSEAISGWCVKENASAMLLGNTNCSNADFQPTKPNYVGLTGGGTRYVRVTVRDMAGNTPTASPVMTVTGGSRITFTQLIDVSGSPSGVFNAKCVSCHGAGAPSQAKWSVALSSDPQALIDSSYTDSTSKKTKILQQIGMIAGQTPTHTALSLAEKDKGLINLWLTQTTTPVE